MLFNLFDSVSTIGVCTNEWEKLGLWPGGVGGRGVRGRFQVSSVPMLEQRIEKHTLNGVLKI